MVEGDACPGRCFAALPRKARYFGADGGRGCCANLSLPHFWSVSHHKLPLAYLRERLLVLHLQLLFQGGVEFPTGGKSGGAKGTPWRRRDACDRADESATRVCVGSHAG